MQQIVVYTTREFERALMLFQVLLPVPLWWILSCLVRQTRGNPPSTTLSCGTHAQEEPFPLTYSDRTQASQRRTGMYL
ncbi:hypothetical protein CPB83DRAFT_852579 [Crepidotus variabilis]|uniref:Uncharacterized protein n=1 Tax=Crepidotus variabilis TaxID=179855 RepID=A0A9P6EGX1_9AGAR|nr:hypothetical protein CPB83DRAFT_852579 [Crepidotus variabilis]